MASLAAALLAMFGAAGRPAAGSVRANGTIDSIFFSVSLPLFVAAAAVVLSSLFRMFTRGRRGPTDEPPEPRPWWQQLMGVVLVLALVSLMVYLILSSPHRHHLYAVAPTTRRALDHATRAGRVVQVNDIALAASSALVALSALTFFLLRRRHAFGRSGPALLFPHEHATLQSLNVGAVAEAVPPLPDPSLERDPARSIVLAFRGFVALMGRAGWPRAEHETAIEFSHRAATVPPLAGAGEPAARLASLFGAARYGPGPLTEADRRNALECFATLTTRLRGGR